MADVQLRTLRVQAEMDASGFQAGASQVTASSKEAGGAVTGLGAKVGAVGDAVAQADAKISRAVTGIERLKTTYIDGYGAAQRMDQAIRQANRALELGRISADDYSRVLDGIKRKYDAINSTKLNAANVNIASASGLEQSRRQNLGYQLMDIGQSAALGAPLAMIAAQQVPQIVQIYAMQGGLKALMADMAGLAVAGGPAIAALGGLYGAYRILNAYSAEARLEVDGVTRALAAQAAPFDAISGKVRDLAQAQAGYNDALLATAGMQDAATRSIVANSRLEFEAKKALLELELARQEAAQKLRESEIAIAGVQLKRAVGDTVLTNPGLVRQGFADPAINGGVPFVRLPDDVTGLDKTNAAIAANPAADKLKELTAQSKLAQIAIDQLKHGLDLVFNPGGTVSGGGAASANEPVDRLKAYTDALIKMGKAQRDLYNPAPTGPIPNPTARPLIELEGDGETAKTQSAYQQMLQTADQRLAQLRNEIALVGQSAAAQARLRAEFEAEAQYREQIARTGQTFNQQELEALKQRAAAYAQLNSQLAAMKALQGQQDSMRSLQLEAQLIGASARERAAATAGLQAELQLRQQGVDLGSREAQQYVANAQAMAQWKLQIDQMSEGWSKVQDAGMSAIDSLTSALTGQTSWKEAGAAIIKSLLQPLNEMAIANPLKNAIYGTNLPTMDSIGGFGGFLGALTGQKPGSVPGMPSATASMMVTAGTVMINGGVSGGLGGLAGLIGGTSLPNAPGGLASVLGVASLPSAGTTRTGLPLSTITAANGLTADVNSQYAGNFQGFINELAASGYNISSLGGYNYRNIRGTNTLSNHAFGNAIDINPMANPDTGRGGPLITDMPSNVSSMAARWGLNWGGDWQSKKDAMHFEVAKGAQPIGFDQSLSSVATSAQAASKNIADLGQSSTSAGQSLMNAFSPTASSGTGLSGLLGGGQLPSNYFPAAPSAPAGGGFNPLSLFTGLFSLFGFADGTDYSPGGIAMVGERGRELIRMPRGSQVIPNHKLNQIGGGGGGIAKVDVGVAMDDNGGMRAYVKRVSYEAAQDVSSRNTSKAINAYDQKRFSARMKQAQDDPYASG